MARNVSMWVTNFRYTGETPTVEEVKVDITIHWYDNDGNYHEWTGEGTYPGDLEDLPASLKKQILREVVERVVRYKLGVD